MRDFSQSIDIDAPPERVWALMRDVERWHEWTPSITSITRLDDGPLRPGSRVRIRQPKLPAAVWEVTRLDEQRGFDWISRGPGARVTARHDLVPVDGGSRVTLSLRYDGPLGGLIGWTARTLIERYVAWEADGLKRASEARVVAAGRR